MKVIVMKYSIKETKYKRLKEVIQLWNCIAMACRFRFDGQNFVDFISRVPTNFLPIVPFLLLALIEIADFLQMFYYWHRTVKCHHRFDPGLVPHPISNNFRGLFQVSCTNAYQDYRSIFIGIQDNSLYYLRIQLSYCPLLRAISQPILRQFKKIRKVQNCI